MSSPTFVARAVNGTVWSTVFYAVTWDVDRTVHEAVHVAVSNVVYWAVERPSTEASSGFPRDYADHPALQDFLHEVRSSRSKTVNEALERKLYDVAERVVSTTVSRDVDDASNRAVWRTVASPAGLSVFEEVYRATEVDPISSALQDFLHEAEAVRSDPEGPRDAASVYLTQDFLHSAELLCARTGP